MLHGASPGFRYCSKRSQCTVLGVDCPFLGGSPGDEQLDLWPITQMPAGSAPAANVVALTKNLQMVKASSQDVPRWDSHLEFLSKRGSAINSHSRFEECARPESEGFSKYGWERTANAAWFCTNPNHQEVYSARTVSCSTMRLLQ